MKKISSFKAYFLTSLLLTSLSVIADTDYCNFAKIPSNYQWCADKLKTNNLTYSVCPGAHCDGSLVNAAYHSACGTLGPSGAGFPVQSFGCCNPVTQDYKDDDYATMDALSDACEAARDNDKNWHFAACYCCCQCLAENTHIAMANSTEKMIKDISEGEYVLAAGVNWLSEGAFELNWKATEVVTNGGSGGDEPGMIYINYGNGSSNKWTIVSPDQVFMLSSGKLVKASNLLPIHGSITDQLLDKEGNTVAINTVSLGYYSGGIKHITLPAKDKVLDPNYHLILTEGVVAGDYYLQQTFDNLDEKYKTASANSNEALEMTNKESLLARSENSWIYTNQKTVAFPSNFVPYETRSVPLLGNETSYISSEASNKILALRASRPEIQYPVYSKAKYFIIKDLLAKLKGKYPEIEIKLVWEAEEPNVYSFVKDGKQFITIAGGLVRMKCLSGEGLALILGNAIGRFQPDETHEKGYASFEKADEYAKSIFSRNIFYGDSWFNKAPKGYDQLKQFFQLVNEANNN